MPGDKSISHRALMLAALAAGESRIENPCDGTDILATVDALRALGARIDPLADGSWSVRGVGAGALLHPERTLDLGNSGTAARLLMGLVASHPIRATFAGDASLNHRPMARVAQPLRRLGARIEMSSDGRLPLLVQGRAPALPLAHRLDLPSAQVKSAMLLAGLNIPGFTVVEEKVPTRDHLERLLPLFGAEIEIGDDVIRLRGEAELRPVTIDVPGDPSAAAFLTVAASIVPGSELRIRNVCINPRRTGLFDLLREMGANIVISGQTQRCNEPVADLLVRHSALHRIDVPPAIVPSMIDEFPILFIAAAVAEGTTRARGLQELRVKESDRIAAMADALQAVGVRVDEDEDGLGVIGSGGGQLRGGATVKSRGDHRIAMALAVAGLHAGEPIVVDDMAAIDTSFPGFLAALDGLVV